MMEPLKIGIMSSEDYRAMTLDVVAGKRKMDPDAPKVWVASMKVLGGLLDDKNLRLLKLIRERHPDSIAALAKMAGREPNNVSRTLKNMARYGIVGLEKHNRMVRPVAKASDIQVQIAV
ncbi:HVO_A0114 family putative DNA-binding protein [Marinobacter sp. SS21]|uniref:HVO_A0114 family putative DNA-binding protein n=1 Tax=Marinobacter sp. SS21 TaxID=2979460 RepID=UPI00232C5576|nr:transcriptional regulator [Marinobacter sp. SS21]MDC0662436.1 transcriptional regulator [Marinobacter sp. SS21]